MLCGVGTNWFDINVEYGQAHLERIIVESRLQNRRIGEVAMLDGRLQTRRIYRVSQARLGRACSTTLCTMPAWRMIMVWSGKELFVRARLTQRTVDTVSSPPQEGSERRFLGKENLYQRRNLMVWFSIFASLTLKEEHSHYLDLTMVRNARYDKIWLTHFWTFWVCYFSAKAELISSFFMSSALRQSLAAWNGLQRGCFQIFLYRICISVLLH